MIQPNLNVNYMLHLSHDYCILSIDMTYCTDINCKLLSEYFMASNNYSTIFVRQNYLLSTNLKIETFKNYI